MEWIAYALSAATFVASGVVSGLIVHISNRKLEEAKTEMTTALETHRATHAGKLEALKNEFQRETQQHMETFKKTIRESELIESRKWEIKRQACMDALAIIDAVYSNFTWALMNLNTDPPTALEGPIPQRVNINTARSAMNGLFLSCELPDAVLAYKACMRDGGDTSRVANLTALRNAIRQELKFGALTLGNTNGMDLWIASLKGSETAPVASTQPRAPETA